MPKNCSHEEKKIDKAEVLNMSYPRESNFNTFDLTPTAWENKGHLTKSVNTLNHL